jgi:preprotein translocase subunit SecE
MAVTTRKQTEAARPENRWSRFFRETYDELRKVVWPTPQELYRYTVVVVVTVLLLSSFIGLVDAGVSELVRRFIYSVITKS